MTLEMVRNPDILAEVAEWRQVREAENLAGNQRIIVVGFAAETNDLLANARSKLEAKALDLIVANPVPQSFAGDAEQATLVERGGAVTELAPMPKEELAGRILDFVAGRLG
jgi:phosphopantothenoylcysteine decarboxylase/phosphopantothenate--cysteine ligase